MNAPRTIHHTYHNSINGISFLPKSVTIVGSGIIAIEYAKIFRNLGAEVTMLVRGKARTALERIGEVVPSARLYCTGALSRSVI